MTNENRIPQLRSHRWPSGDSLAIATICVSLDDLARRFGWTVDRYVEDGLGAMSSVVCQLPSGMVLRFEQSQHLVESGREKGPSVYADAGLVRSAGPVTLRDECLVALGLSAGDVSWTQDPQDIV